MDPNAQRTPGVFASSQGSDWQREAISAARAAAAAHPTPAMEAAPARPIAREPDPVIPQPTFSQLGPAPPPPPPPGPQPAPPAQAMPPLPSAAPQSVPLPVVTPMTPAMTTAPILGVNDQSYHSKKWAWFIVTPLLVIGLGVGLYFAFFVSQGGDKQAERKETAKATPAAPQPIALGTQERVVFEVPAGITTSYTLRRDEADYKSYVTQDNTCEIDIAKSTAVQQPGKDVEEILAPSVKAYRDSGALVTGPTTTNALILKDSESAAKTYTMPTLYTEVSTKDSSGKTTYAAGYYSIAIQPNTDRQVIVRSCVTDTALTDSKALLDGIEKEVKQIKVNTAAASPTP